MTEDVWKVIARVDAGQRTGLTELMYGQTGQTGLTVPMMAEATVWMYGKTRALIDPFDQPTVNAGWLAAACKVVELHRDSEVPVTLSYKELATVLETEYRQAMSLPALLPAEEQHTIWEFLARYLSYLLDLTITDVRDGALANDEPVWMALFEKMFFQKPVGAING